MSVSLEMLKAADLGFIYINGSAETADMVNRMLCEKLDCVVTKNNQMYLASKVFDIEPKKVEVTEEMIDELFSSEGFFPRRFIKQKLFGDK